MGILVGLFKDRGQDIDGQVDKQAGEMEDPWWAGEGVRFQW